MRVLKFGGTSVGDAAAFKRAVEIVRAYESAPVVVVVSAMSGMTDALISANRDVINKHLARHVEVAECRDLIESSRHEIAALLDANLPGLQKQDAIAAYGETLCARLFTMVLEHHGIPASYVDARRCIVTDGLHGNANPLVNEVGLRTRAEVDPLVKMKRVPVLGGFIGATSTGVTTTLGRGSSDYSATLIGAALQAEEIEIWTDVDGVQTADPNLVPGTRTVPIISYDEAAQLAVLGARVMHPKMIEPVLERRIPIRVRNSRAPEQEGTRICSASESRVGVVKAIAHRMNGTHAIVGCVGDGLSNGSAGAAVVRRVLREVDSSIEWESTAPCNLVARVERAHVLNVVRLIHDRLFNLTRR